MKKILFILSIMSICFIYSCTKTEMEERTKNRIPSRVEEFEAEDYGFMHNELCEYLENKFPQILNYTFTNTDSMTMWADSCAGYFLINGFNLEETSDAIELVKGILHYYGDDQSGESYILLSLKGSNSIIEQYLANENYSSSFIDEISDIMDLSREEIPDTAEINTTLENFHTIDFGSENENFSRDVFYEVYKYSETYWQTKQAGDPPPGFTCEEWVIAMDGLGALMGLTLGPVGSIILGTLFSIGAERECQE